MAVYLISYDLNNSGKNYEGVHKAIKGINNIWCRPLESLWLVKTSYTPDEICAHVQKFMDKDDHILVIEIKDNYQGFLSTNIQKYIRDEIFG